MVVNTKVPSTLVYEVLNLSNINSTNVCLVFRITPLMLACARGDEAMVQILIDTMLIWMYCKYWAEIEEGDFFPPPPLPILANVTFFFSHWFSNFGS